MREHKKLSGEEANQTFIKLLENYSNQIKGHENSPMTVARAFKTLERATKEQGLESLLNKFLKDGEDLLKQRRQEIVVLDPILPQPSSQSKGSNIGG
jgi:hypothetical protein